jgi:hypothetical protein
MFGSKRQRNKDRESDIMRSFILCALHRMLLGLLHEGGRYGNMWCRWDDEKCIHNFKLGNLKGRHHLSDLGVGGRIILK